MSARQIKTQPDRGNAATNIQISGWLSGKQTYLWFGQGDKFIGSLGGQKLYRLAKAITRQFEAKP